MGQLPLQAAHVFWLDPRRALLPAGDQVPAVSELALPAGGPPQPRRPDRGALVGRGGLSIGEIRRGLNAERLSGRTLVDRSVA